VRETRKPFFHETPFFLHLFAFLRKNNILITKYFEFHLDNLRIFRSGLRRLTSANATYRGIHSLIPKTPRLFSQISSESGSNLPDSQESSRANHDVHNVDSGLWRLPEPKISGEQAQHMP
jgi:hypothetical protein